MMRIQPLPRHMHVDVKFVWRHQNFSSPLSPIFVKTWTFTNICIYSNLYTDRQGCVVYKTPMVEWYCRICRCRTTGAAAAHVTQLSEFLWLPSPSQTTIRRLKIRAQRHSAHNSARRNSGVRVCANSQGFFAHSTQKGKSRMAVGTALHYCQ